MPATSSKKKIFICRCAPCPPITWKNQHTRQSKKALKRSKKNNKAETISTKTIRHNSFPMYSQELQQGSGKVPARFHKGSSKVPKRFQQGSGKVPSKVPARFQQGSGKVLARFHKGSSKVPARFQKDSSKVPARFQQGSKRVPRPFRFFRACIFVAPLSGPRDSNPTLSLLRISLNQKIQIPRSECSWSQILDRSPPVAGECLGSHDPGTTRQHSHGLLRCGWAYIILKIFSNSAATSWVYLYRR